MSEGGGSKSMALPRKNDEIPDPRDSASKPAVRQLCELLHANAVACCCGGLRGAHPVRNKAEAEGIKSRGH